jgi:hypothetical protein
MNNHIDIQIYPARQPNSDPVNLGWAGFVETPQRLIAIGWHPTAESALEAADIIVTNLGATG